MVCRPHLRRGGYAATAITNLLTLRHFLGYFFFFSFLCAYQTCACLMTWLRASLLPVMLVWIQVWGMGESVFTIQEILTLSSLLSCTERNPGLTVPAYVLTVGLRISSWYLTAVSVLWSLLRDASPHTTTDHRHRSGHRSQKATKTNPDALKDPKNPVASITLK